MLDVAKMDVTLPPAVAEDIQLGALLAACDVQPTAPLAFAYEGRTIRPGYHVTEVKAGQFAALDCGGNPEAWSEIFVQLWDVVDGDRTHMTAGKFAAIIRKVSEHVGLDLSARLTFEVSGIGIAPFLWFLLTLRGSGGQNHAALQEIEACPSVALALDELEPVDLAFGLPAAPWLHESSPDGSDVRL